MIRFQTVEGKSVAVEARHIVTAEPVTNPLNVKSLLSGGSEGVPAVKVTIVTGQFFVVLDPNGTVLSQIETAKKEQG